MAARIPTRLLCGSLVAVLATVALATAEEPRTDAPVTPAEPAAQPAPIEVYYGTVKVSPVTAPASEPRQNTGPITQAAGTEPAADWAPGPRTEPRMLPTGGIGVLPTSAPAPGWAPSWSEPARPPAAAPTFVVIREPEHAPAPQAQAAPPTVIVVREPDPRTAFGALPVEPEWVLGGALVLGLLLLAVVVRRPAPITVAPAPITVAPAPAPVAPAPEPVPAPVPEPKPETVRLSGEYDVGPLPKTAQKFDVGPSYQEERQVKEQREEESGAAVLEFIVGQNLALREAFAAEPQPAEPPVVAEPRPAVAPAPRLPTYTLPPLFNTPDAADFAVWVEPAKRAATGS